MQTCEAGQFVIKAILKRVLKMIHKGKMMPEELNKAPTQTDTRDKSFKLFEITECDLQQI